MGAGAGVGEGTAVGTGVSVAVGLGVTVGQRVDEGVGAGSRGVSGALTARDGVTGTMKLEQLVRKSATTQ